MTDLVDKILALHNALKEGGIPHAFGGALALAWCTGQARGTIDIDVNLFIGHDGIKAALAAMPSAVRWDEHDVTRFEQDLQQRIWWDQTPLDVFFNSTNYHSDLKHRIRTEHFAGDEVPFLSCVDLAVFKVFFDRTKDWADLEAMHEADTLDFNFVAGVIANYLGPDDRRLSRLFTLRDTGRINL